MAITLKVPASFEKNGGGNLIKAEGFSYVTYGHCQERGPQQVVLTSYMFVVIFNGSKILHTEGQSFEIGQGNAFFAKKGSFIGMERLSPESGRFENLLFFFEDSFLFDFIRRHVDHDCLHAGDKVMVQPAILPLVISPLLKSSIDSLLPYFTQQGPRTQTIVRLKFEEILLNILNADDHLRFHAYLHHLEQDRKKDIAHVVEQNIVNSVTVEELAKLSGRSLTAFKRDFFNLYGEPPRTWINRKRIERAFTLLKTTPTTITDACYDTGFSSISHFIRLFRNAYGMTPKQFQKDQMRQK